MIYTVTDCQEKKRFSNDHGEFVIYTVDLHDGTDTVAAELKQKDTTPAPKQGDRIDGTVEVGQFGRVFKKTMKQGAQGAGRSPAERAEIRRMSSQRAAIELLAVEVAAGLRFTEEQKASDLLLPRIDWMEKDARKAGEQA